MIRKLLYTILMYLCYGVSPVYAGLVCVHDNVRKIPYPQSGHGLYVNPVPLLVPEKMRQSNYLQFNLSQSRDFDETNSFLSKPVPWCMYSPHRVLENGIWYWRVRSVGKTGEIFPWSEIYSFEVTNEVPKFVTPSFDAFLSNIPQKGSRINCFLNESLPEVRKEVRQNEEFEYLVKDSRSSLGHNYITDTKPYKHVAAMYDDCIALNTAYQLLQRNIYADKMVENVRLLLSQETAKGTLDNDFAAGQLAYVLALTYETCYERFSDKERRQIEGKLIQILEKYYRHVLGYVENHIFENHYWQFTYRRLLQAALVVYDRHPLAKEYLEYSYELWSCRAPASGYNRDGAWHNGTCYFSANAITLYYVPMLFSYITKVDFMQHPWYKNVGQAMTYSWQPNSMSIGYGDGYEQTNNNPLRMRSAFADLMARQTGDVYATWYSSINTRYKEESETRFYRMAGRKSRPVTDCLPKDVPKAVWLKDIGEVITNSNLADTKKNVSLSFHSSPFGSGSHTHSNQNAFNLHYAGVPIFGSVGYYLNFADKHNILSYRHTRAHNTILIDGIGQSFTTKAYGNIVRMFDGEHITYALGDASNAYRESSEYTMWQRILASQGLEQTPEYGFGKTPLRKFRRHVFLLHPNIVVIYDELEADKAVKWDWLLHSYNRFDINETNMSFFVNNERRGVRAVGCMFGEQLNKVCRENGFVAEPDEKMCVRGEELLKPWTMIASTAPCKRANILTVMQVEADGMESAKVHREAENKFRIGNWIIEAGLNGKHPANLYIHNAKNGATFTYGNKNVMMGGTDYTPENRFNSVLYDKIDGGWKVKESGDSHALYTGVME